MWAEEAGTAREVAAGSDVTILCVTGAPEVESIAYGENGLLSGVRSGQIVIDWTTSEPAMGPNGSGKTTLFELITGSNEPTRGQVRCLGRNIHRVKYRERDRLAIHYHQSYQVRHFCRRTPSSTGRAPTIQ